MRTRDPKMRKRDTKMRGRDVSSKKENKGIASRRNGIIINTMSKRSIKGRIY
jgi:hypothetical protein